MMNSFFDEHSSRLPGDGLVSIKIFEGVKTLLIDCKDNVLEINAPIPKKKGIPMYRLDTKITTAFYIYGELDGVKQPFILTSASTEMIVREDISECTIYEGDELDEILQNKKTVSKSANRPLQKYIAKIKIGDILDEFWVHRYDDDFLTSKNKGSLLLASAYNFLGLPFFKDKCVQFDFENMMLYVW